MTDRTPKVEMLQASVDEEDESHFRFLVDGKSIKYLIVDPSLFTAEQMCFAPELIPLIIRLQTSDIPSAAKMREQDCHMYTCGCKKLEQFRQCAPRLGTNEKCSPVRQIRLEDSSHMCSRYMVKPGKDRMQR